MGCIYLVYVHIPLEGCKKHSDQSIQILCALETEWNLQPLRITSLMIDHLEEAKTWRTLRRINARLSGWFEYLPFGLRYPFGSHKGMSLSFTEDSVSSTNTQADIHPYSARLTHAAWRGVSFEGRNLGLPGWPALQYQPSIASTQRVGLTPLV